MYVESSSQLDANESVESNSQLDANESVESNSQLDEFTKDDCTYVRQSVGLYRGENETHYQ
jgi:hypothetical protein